MKMGEAVMIKLNGVRFACGCCCNVFIRVEPFKGKEVFKCNACGKEYQTERKDDSKGGN